jgi:hypothetical protein
MRPTRNVRMVRAMGLCGVVALAVALTGCSGSRSDGKASDAPTAAASAASAPATAGSAASAGPDAREKAALAHVYSRMWDEQMKAYRKADAMGTELEKYATYEALTQFRNDLDRMKRAGTVVRGELAHHDTTVTHLDLEAKTPKAALSDCMDVSKWQTYSTKKNRVIPMPSAQPLRYIATATAERWRGRWLITTFTTHGDQPC